MRALAGLVVATSLDPDNGADGGGTTSSRGECHLDSLPVGQYRVDVLEADEVVDRLLQSVETEVTAGETRLLRIVVPSS
jgi:hypothetical protein